MPGSSPTCCPWGTGGTPTCRPTSPHDLRARLQALPKVKLLGYYSDAYKLEFIAPKFNMYRRILADVLSEEAIRGRGWSVDEALQLAKLILIDNPKRVFGGAERRLRRSGFDLGAISRHASGTRGDRYWVAVRTYLAAPAARVGRSKAACIAGRGISRHVQHTSAHTRNRRFCLLAFALGLALPLHAQMTGGPGLSSGTGPGTGAGGFTGVLRNRPARCRESARAPLRDRRSEAGLAPSFRLQAGARRLPLSGPASM